ncbi:response regulator [Ethanoligenens harbinense]|uniref:response regulator n=1 Tax=Ethanoligenens harbinense TaxID=253239 RepID=UPI000EA3BD7A|nr:response regulator [Ethanoligenens harbinense]AYF41761.1 response regulator [Ethanoligenens harbinense]
MANVLVVDDTKNIRVLLTQCLEFEGYSVTTASHGKEALDILGNKKFDLVFLDVRMPELSGTEVLRQMRQMGADMPVVMITAFGTVKNAVDCTQLGAVAYLQKPFTESKIHQVLEEVLQLKSEADPFEHVLALAKKEIASGKLKDAEVRLKNALPSYFLTPGLYAALSEVYTETGRPEEAKKCSKIALLLQSQMT